MVEIETDDLRNTIETNYPHYASKHGPSKERLETSAWAGDTNFRFAFKYITATNSLAIG